MGVSYGKFIDLPVQQEARSRFQRIRMSLNYRLRSTRKWKPAISADDDANVRGEGGFLRRDATEGMMWLRPTESQIRHLQNSFIWKKWPNNKPFRRQK